MLFCQLSHAQRLCQIRACIIAGEFKATLHPNPVLTLALISMLPKHCINNVMFAASRLCNLSCNSSLPVTMSVDCQIRQPLAGRPLVGRAVLFLDLPGGLATAGIIFAKLEQGSPACWSKACCHC